MTSTYPPQLAAPAISSLVGGTSLSRGRTYARRGAVSDVEWYPKSLELKARVKGNRSAPYRTKVSFKEGTSGLAPEWGDCSCPMRSNCKHVAALLVEISSGYTVEQPALLDLPPAPAGTHALVQPAAPKQAVPAKLAAPRKQPAPAVQKALQKPAVQKPVQKQAPPAPWQEQIQSLLHPEAA